jgi:hypothetical protein
MLQPLRASLFESEPVEFTEEASEYFAGQLLREAAAPRSPSSKTATPNAESGEPELSSAAAPPPISDRPPLVAIPLHGRPPVALSPETQLPPEAAREQQVFRPTATPASEPVRAPNASSSVRESQGLVPAPQCSARPTGVPVRTGNPAHPTESAMRNRDAEVLASATERKNLAVSSSGRTSLAETNPHGRMVARLAPDMRNITPLFVPANGRDRDEETVEITIGRLEIRAAAPAPPVARASRPQPQRTLAEYLSRNAGRSR